MKNSILKIFGIYVLFIAVLILTSMGCNAQVKAVYFNADWNSANGVDWFNKLDVNKETMDIGEGDCQDKYQIAIVPTIVVFDDGEEVKRFQADLSFKLLATKEEVQDYIDELIISKF